MNKGQALAYLETERSNMETGTFKDDLTDALEILESEESEPEDIEDAMDALNDLYFDATWISQCEAGQAIFAIACSTDQTQPFPKVRI